MQSYATSLEGSVEEDNVVYECVFRYTCWVHLHSLVAVWPALAKFKSLYNYLGFVIIFMLLGNFSLL